MKIGMTLGKYAPFHKGHEYIISTALQEMDKVIVIIYNASEVTQIPTTLRAKWIKEIFPSVEIIIAENGPQETGYTKEIIDKQNRFLIDLLKNRNIHSFYSSEKYGEFVSRALSCDNRAVDIERKHIPISATAIRIAKNTKGIKNFISDCVYNTIKPKYYFIGAPSTGKTTISRYCANLFNGSYCYEYGRDYWFKFQKNHRLTMEDLENIAIGHNSAEDTIFSENSDCVFIDTNIITTYSYAVYYFNTVSTKLKNILRDSLYKYKNVFLCNDDIPFENTWDRSGPGSRQKIQSINKQVLEQYKIKYTLLSGTLEKRFLRLKQEIVI